MKGSVKIIILGSILFAGGIIFGLGGGALSMIDAFSSIQESGVAGDASALTEDISDSLVSTAIGLPIAFIGFSLFVGGTIAYFSNRNKPEPTGDTP